MKAAIMARCAALLLCAGVPAACGNYAQSLETEVASSLQFDTVACADLVARRDALAAVHGEPSSLPAAEKAGARPSHVGLGLGTVLSDRRPQALKERRRALGEIEAMDASIERRNCRGDGRGSSRRRL